MFDVAQCEKDGWKCEVRGDNGMWCEAEFLGEIRCGLVAVNIWNHPPCFHNKENIRNIVKPKAKRFVWETFVANKSIQKIMIDLIEDSTGIRVDHSNAVIETLEKIELAYRNICCPNHAEVWHIIKAEIAKIKKDRGE